MRKTDLDDDDDGAEVADGHSVRVPLTLTDARRLGQFAAFDVRDHQPHYAELTDELRQRRAEARDAYLQQLTNAWRRDAAPEPDEDDPDDNAVRERAYADYCNRLQNAWRTGRTVVGPGPAVVGPGPTIVGPGPTWGGRP